MFKWRRNGGYKNGTVEWTSSKRDLKDRGEYTSLTSSMMQPEPDFPEEDVITDFDENCGNSVCCGNSKKCSSPLIKRLTTAKGALAFLCLSAFLQALIVNGFINAGISTIEKRFHLKSSETGFMASSYDIAFFLPLLLVTYIGGKGNKPLWIGWGLFILGLGSLFFCLPHFLAPTYEHSSIAVNATLCNIVVSNEECKESTLRNYRYFFIFAQILNGFGSCPLYTLAVTYLDENVNQSQSSTYHGIFFAFSILGPAMGYGLGGAALHVFTNVNENVDIDATNALWVGAWWLGPFVGGLLVLVLSFVVMMYPKQLPNTKHLRVNREQELHASSTSIITAEKVGLATSFRDIPKASLALLRNSTMIFLSLGGAMDSALITGLAAFGPKYLEAMYNLTAGTAAVSFGVLAILGGCTGQVLGGYLISRFELTVRSMTRICVLCAAIATVLSTGFLLNCFEKEHFAGATIPYRNMMNVSGIVDDCNINCGCSLEFYDPVCGSDETTYYSSCFAGCTESNSSISRHCSCVYSNSTNSSYGYVTSGKCPSPRCKYFGIFVFILFLSIGVTFLNSMPALQATLRVVPFLDRSFAVGFQSVILRVMGSIPGPLLFGYMLDLSCIVWNKECGVYGSCKVYEKSHLSLYTFAACITFKGLSTLFFGLAWLTYKPIDKEEGDASPILHEDSSQL